MFSNAWKIWIVSEEKASQNDKSRAFLRFVKVNATGVALKLTIDKKLVLVDLFPEK